MKIQSWKQCTNFLKIYFSFSYRFKGVRELFSGDKYDITSEGDKYTLTIRDVFGEDADEYQVRASNRGGSRSSRADLEIKCKALYFLYIFLELFHIDFFFISFFSFCFLMSNFKAFIAQDTVTKFVEKHKHVGTIDL